MPIEEEDHYKALIAAKADGARAALGHLRTAIEEFGQCLEEEVATAPDELREIVWARDFYQDKLHRLSAFAVLLPEEQAELFRAILREPVPEKDRDA